MPEHPYAEVLAVFAGSFSVKSSPSRRRASAVGRLGGWHLRQASVAPLVQAAWSYRHNLTAAGALYFALGEQLDASLLTDDHRLVQAPTFPSQVPVMRLPASL